MKKLLSILMFLVAIVTGTSAADATYVPQGVKNVTTNETIYCTDITSAGTAATDWVVVPSHGTSSLKYTNTTNDTKGNPSGITDNIETITSNANMIKIKTDGNTFSSDKRVVHMHVKGITGVIGHGYTGNSGRGMAIACTEYVKGSTTTMASASASVTRTGSGGSFICQATGLDASKEYIVSFYATGGDDNFYCAELIAGTDASNLEITPASGSYVGKVSVSMSANDGYTIYYTDNGDTPTSESTEYTGAFDVTSDKTIKAIAYKSGTPGAVKTANYTIVSVGGSTVYNLDAPTAADLAALRDAENAAWTDNGSEYISNAVDWAANTDNAIQDKDGNDISVANGLKFGRANNLSAGSFRYYYKSGNVEDYRIYFNNSSSYVKIPNVKKGQSVIITLAAGGSRTFTMTNATPASYSYTGENTKVTKVFVANADGTVSISNSNGGFSIYKIEVAVTEQVTIGKGGYSTYASDYNYVIVDGATAYTAQNKENSVAMTEIPAGTVIPAGKGVILKGEEDAKASIKLTTDAAGTVTTDMVGVTEANQFNPSDNNSVYVIATKAAGTKFYKYTGATFPEGKAYLYAVANAGDALDIDFGGETAINGIKANTNSAAPVKVIKNGKLYIGNYNVAGQQVK